MTNESIGSRRRRGFRWLNVLWLFAAALLLAPLVAMQFTDEVNWTLSDFLAFGLMLTVALGCLEIAARTTSDRRYQAGAALAVGAAFLLVWINGAVGLVGDERGPAGPLFNAVVGIAFVGAVLARFRPRGMARAMIAAALAQVAAAAIALLAGWGNAVLPTAFFVGLWLASAALFRSSPEGA